MSSTPVLNDEQWSKLLEHVAETFNEVTLSRGFHFYKQQMVTSLLISSELRSVHATVEEFGENCKVAIDLQQLKSSTCSCPVKSTCKHIASALMELADRLGYPASQIVNAKMALRRMASLSANASTLDQVPSMTAQSWHKFLELYTYQIKPTYDQSSYVEILRQQFAQLKKTPIAFTPVDQLFFELHQKLFILRKIVELNEQTGVNFFAPATVYHLSDELDDWLKASSMDPSGSNYQDRMTQTLAYIRGHMETESPKKLHHFRVFTTFWTHWVAAEIEHVGEAKTAKESEKTRAEFQNLLTAELSAFEALDAAELSLSLCAGRAYLYMQQSKPAKAWEAITAHAGYMEAPSLLFAPFLSDLARVQNWPEMVQWLYRLRSFYGGKRHYELEAYAAYWKNAVAHLPEAESQMWQAFEELLPTSYRLIETLLYEQRKWKSWIEMQIVQGYDPFAHRVNVLQPIEKESPEFLLPYYHQAVEHYIRLKNRHDYKAAVRLLKRLEKVYKKMKQPERWEAFFTRFVSRYSRLRALQEELKKGKLLE